MSVIRLKYVDRFLDRFGKTRYYFRRPRGPRTPLPGLPGSGEFMEAYRNALQGVGASVTVAPPRVRGEAGTIERLYFEYLRSPDFLRLKEISQQHYRIILEPFVAEHGHRLVSQMKREHVRLIIAQKASTPGAANNLLNKLKVLMGFAIDLEWRPDDPTARIKRFRGGEYHTWTEAEIAQFEARWPIGSRERTAFALHLYTGQRRSDVARMGWPDVSASGDAIRVTQEKSRGLSSPEEVRLWIPLHDELRSILNSWPRTNVTILTTTSNRPFSTSNSYGHWLLGKIQQADLPKQCVIHGLRKAAARRLAEAGCTAKEIAAVTGHRTLREVERYTRAADQRELARSALAKLPQKNKV